MAKNYLSFSRTFRPQRFDEVIGQEAIVTTLKNALKQKRASHAYLFCGPRGCGKTTLARLFAKALCCSTPTEQFEPCNACPSCQEIAQGRSLDVIEIDGASNRSIEDIRQINETVGYAPASGLFKIYMIDEVHMLTKEAFNALLKTLEEPPSHVKFFFATTEPHKVLPTILSRCQRFDLGRLTESAIAQKLKKIAEAGKEQIDPPVFELVASKADGSLRDAESLLDQLLCLPERPLTVASSLEILGMLPRETFLKLDRAMADTHLPFAFELAEKIYLSGKDIGYFVEELKEHIAAILKAKLQGGSHPSATLYSVEQCLYLLDYLIERSAELAKTPFKRSHLEMILLHLIRSRCRISIESLVQRLCELENAGGKGEAPQVAPLPPAPLELPKQPEAALPLTPTPVPAPAPAPESKTIPPSSRLDTFLRFAAVELEGTLKKN